MTLRDKMFSFEGRLRRADYWYISILLGVMVFAATEIVMWSVFGSEYSLLAGGFEASERRAAAGWPYVVLVLINAMTFWPSLAMSAKRLHDQGKSARLIVGLLVVFEIYGIAQAPLTGWLTRWASMPTGLLSYAALTLLALAGVIYVFVVVGCLDGTPGSNRFGPSPKTAELTDANDE